MSSILLGYPTAYTLPNVPYLPYTNNYAQGIPHSHGDHHGHSHGHDHDHDHEHHYQSTTSLDTASSSISTSSSSPSSSSSALTLTNTIQSIQCTLDGRICAVTAQNCIYFYSLVGGECVSVGIWHRHESSSTNGRPDTPRSAVSTSASNVLSCAFSDVHPRILCVASESNVVSVLRLAERPDLTDSSIHDNHPAMSSLSNPNSPNSSDTTLQQSLLPTDSSLSIPAFPPTITSTQASTSPTSFNGLASFPNADWHDNMSAHVPSIALVTTQIQSRIKLSNDEIAALCVYNNIIIIGTCGGFLQFVTMLGQPIGCVHVHQTWTIRHICVCPKSGILGIILSNGKVVVSNVKHIHSKEHFNTIITSGRTVNGSNANDDSANDNHTNVDMTSTWNCAILPDLDQHHTVSIAIHRHSLVVLNSNGSLYMYTVYTSFDQSISVKLDLQLHDIIPKDEYREHHQHQFPTVCWSPDGLSFAIRTSRGISVYGKQGACIGTTLSEPTSLEVKIPKPLAWTPDGFGLFYSSAVQSSPGGVDGLLPDDMLKDSVIRTPFLMKLDVAKSIATPHAPCLLRSDRVLVWIGKHENSIIGSHNIQFSSAFAFKKRNNADSTTRRITSATRSVKTSAETADPLEESTPCSMSNGRKLSETDEFHVDDHHQAMNESELEWEEIRAPPSYLAYYWPLQHCALSPSGQHLAIAGTRGFALYNRRSKKWKLFSNEQHESLVYVRDLHWYGEHIISALVMDGPNGPVHHQFSSKSPESYTASCVTMPPPLTGLYAVPPVEVSLSKPVETAGSIPPKTVEKPMKQKPVSSSSNVVFTHHGSEILFFSRHKLNLHCILHSIRFPSEYRIESMDISDHNLIVLSNSSILSLFNLHTAVSIIANGSDGSTTPTSSFNSHPSSDLTSSHFIPYNTTVFSIDFGENPKIIMAAAFDVLVNLQDLFDDQTPNSLNILARTQYGLSKCLLWTHPSEPIDRYTHSVFTDTQKMGKYVPTNNTNTAPSDAAELSVYVSSSTAITPAMKPLNQHDESSQSFLRDVTTCIVLHSSGAVLSVDIGPRLRSNDASQEVALLECVAWCRLISRNTQSLWIVPQWSSVLDHQSIAASSEQSFKALDHKQTTHAVPLNSKIVSHTNRLFTSGDAGVQVWFRSLEDLPGHTDGRIAYSNPISTLHPTNTRPQPPSLYGLSIISSDQSLNILGFDAPNATILTLFSSTMPTTTMSLAAYDPPFSLSSFSLRLTSRPFLHILLAEFCKRASFESSRPHPHSPSSLHNHPSFEFALSLGNSLRTADTFSISLELLLHYALSYSRPEQGTPWASKLSEADFLHSVLTFIQSFPQYYSILAHCARKHDSSQWKRIFSLSGSPLALFNSSIHAKQYQTAALYILLIQRTESIHIARNCAKQLVHVILKRKQLLMTSKHHHLFRVELSHLISIVNELKRFLRLTKPMEMEQLALEQQQQHRHQSATLPPLSSSNSNHPSSLISPSDLHSKLAAAEKFAQSMQHSLDNENPANASAGNCTIQ